MGCWDPLGCQQHPRVLGGGRNSPLDHFSLQPPGVLGATDLLLDHVEGVEHVNGELHEDGS